MNQQPKRMSWFIREVGHDARGIRCQPYSIVGVLNGNPSVCQNLPREDRGAKDVNWIRRTTDEHMAVVEHQLNQHLRNGDPNKLWRTPSQAEKELTSCTPDE